MLCILAKNGNIQYLNIRNRDFDPLNRLKSKNKKLFTKPTFKFEIFKNISNFKFGRLMGQNRDLLKNGFF